MARIINTRNVCVSCFITLGIVQGGRTSDGANHGEADDCADGEMQADITLDRRVVDVSQEKFTRALLRNYPENILLTSRTPSYGCRR